MKRLAIIGGMGVALLLGACRHTPEFRVSGTIRQAGGEVVYLEHTALMQTCAVDSCVVGKDGAFRVSAPAPAYPDFYQLRVGAKRLPLAIDSTEDIVLTASRDSLPYTQDITGSPNSVQIAELRAMARTADREALREKTRHIIIANPRSLVAYYALFFKQNGTPLWDINAPADRKMYQAVATSFYMAMPDYERTQALYKQVLDAINAERALRNQAALQQLIDNADNAFLDITLPDEDDCLQTLSDLRGRVILLDFSAIEMEQSKGYIFELRDLYNKYHARGLEIYSVSLDRNRLLWQQAVQSLPWITVRAAPEDYAGVVVPYNVQSVPVLFLFDRKGNVQGRYTDFERLDADLRKYL